MYLALDGLAVEIGELHSLLCNYGEIAIGKEKQVAGVKQDRGHVGGDEVFVFAETNDGRRAITGSHNLIRVVNGDHDQRKYSRQFLNSLTYGLFEGGPIAVAGFQVIVLDEVGDHLSVGFGSELVALFLELSFEGEIIFDDAIMDDDDPAGAVAMGMGVLFGGAAVSGPTSVSDAVGAIQRFIADDVFQIAQLALGAPDL